MENKEFFKQLTQFINEYLNTTDKPTFIGFLEYKNKKK